MRAQLFLCTLLGAACVVQSATPPLKSGDGVGITDGTVSVDETKVPVLPNCAAGSLVRRTENGWECMTPAAAKDLMFGDGLTVSGQSVSVHFGSGHADVSR